jgi:hypothetical protein
MLSAGNDTIIIRTSRNRRETHGEYYSILAALDRDSAKKGNNTFSEI